VASVRAARTLATSVGMTFAFFGVGRKLQGQSE
jgi:hypothetical protein